MPEVRACARAESGCSSCSFASRRFTAVASRSAIALCSGVAFAMVSCTDGNQLWVDAQH